MCVNAHDRKVQVGVLAGHRQPIRPSVQFDDQGQARPGPVGQPNNSQPTDFQQSRQRGRTGGDAVRHVHLIVRHQFEAAREKPQNKVGLSAPRRPNHQNRVSVP